MGCFELYYSCNICSIDCELKMYDIFSIYPHQFCFTFMLVPITFPQLYIYICNIIYICRHEKLKSLVIQRRRESVVLLLLPSTSLGSFLVYWYILVSGYISISDSLKIIDLTLILTETLISKIVINIMLFLQILVF